MTEPVVIQYRFEPLPAGLKQASPYSASEGLLRLVVAGTNLCELDRDPPARFGPGRREDLYDNLFPYVPWLERNFAGFFREEPFPLPFPARTGAEFERAALEALKSFEDTESIDRTADALADWSGRHGLATATDGGFPPNVFFRRVRGGVEVSWDSSRVRPYQGACRFRNERGAAVVDAKVFQHTLEAFIQDFLLQLRARLPELNGNPEILAALRLAEGLGGVPT